ncbi:MAG: sigma-54 factor interaction domain-containing protein, partial [Synechococcales cyanobacterium RU_4_20]|nr:sigma-54 factor interaction domain-containing protein [Synechococcales cyanobacterium RU_4_20]
RSIARSRSCGASSRRRGGLGPLLGVSAGMQEIYRLIEMAAPSPAPVLILGETGTGKEVIARAVHKLSKRSDRGVLLEYYRKVAQAEKQQETYLYGRWARRALAARDRPLAPRRGDVDVWRPSSGTATAICITTHPATTDTMITQVLGRSHHAPRIQMYVYGVQSC